MFPIAFAPGNISNRTPRADDMAGLSDLYPDDGFNARTGSISGRVTKNGQGVFGAHVVAFDPVTGSLVANFTLNAQGEFSIAGLSPGPHVIRVEPLDDADPESFFSSGSAARRGLQGDLLRQARRGAVGRRQRFHRSESGAQVKRLALAGAVVAAMVLPASPAAAQSGDAAQPGRVEVAFGAIWSGRTPFGSANATETAGTGGPFVLFTTSSELASAAGAEARIGVRLTRLLQAEATASYSAPELRTKVSADVEQAAPVTATDRLQQITVGGALVLDLPWRLGARGVPFVTGGAAYLRQLHEGQTAHRERPGVLRRRRREVPGSCRAPIAG